MIYLLLLPLFLYLVILILLFTLQTRMVFPASAAAAGAMALPAGAERLTVATPDGHTLHGSRIPPRQASARGEAPLLLGFAGNAWNADAAAHTLHQLYPVAEIVTFHYRGYAPSTGVPGAKALNDDALLIHDHLARGAPDRRIVAVGFSVGTGVAAHLAAHRPIAGAILVTPFDDLARVAADHYPWLPVRLLFRHRMDSAAALRNSRVPVAIVAAGSDTLILPRRTDALRRSVANLVSDRTIERAGHNDIYDHPAFRPAMQEALAAVLRPRSSAPAG